MNKSVLSLTISALALGLAANATAQESETANSISEAFAKGEASLGFRYRAEYVDQDGPSKEAKASTLKSRVTFNSLPYNGFSGTFEMDNNSVVFDDNYNDGSGNDSDPEAVVPDATYTEINQAYLNFAAGDTILRYGRQRLLLDNQRFVGGVGWRQNEQTFDAFAIVNSSIPDTTITVANVYNVNTAKGGDIDGNDHQIYHITNKSIEGLNVSAYYYDLKEISDTQGLRLSGDVKVEDLKLLYTAEFAQQTTDNDAENETDYINLEAGVAIAGITAKLGYEVQSSDDGAAAFSTPLGTNHAFNGWADQFLSTPAVGLKDQSLTLATAELGPKISLTYHQFDADEGNTDFGNEIDIAISKKFNENYSALLKAAHFDARSDSGKVDTTKVWLQLEAKF